MDFAIALTSNAAKDEDLLARIASHGFAGIEVDFGSPVAAEAGLGPLDVKRLTSSCKKHGLRLRSVAMGWQMSPTSPLYGSLARAEVRQDAFEALVSCLDVAQALGAEVVLLPFFGAGDLRSPDALDSATRGLRRLGEVARSKRLRIGIETTLPAAGVLELLRELDSEFVGSYYDVGNAMALGYPPVTELRHLAGHVVAVQFKEFVPPDGWRPASALPTRAEMTVEMKGLNTAVLGHGHVPVREILMHLSEVGFSGPATLEMYPCTLPNVFDAAIAGVSFLRAAESECQRPSSACPPAVR